MTDNDISKNLKDVNQWARIIYMLLFAIGLYFAIIVLYLITVVQGIFAMVTGAPNKNLRDFGGSLSAYIQQITSFLTYTVEDKPFPMADWPAYTAPEMEVAADHTEVPVAEQPAAAEEATEAPAKKAKKSADETAE